jgi:small GTP-binding protein
MRILTAEQETLLNDERKLLNDLRVALVKFGATPEDQETLSDSLAQLDDFFLLVVVGEFNAGKSAFINALLGSSVLKEGVTPTTTQINIVRYGDETARLVENEHLHVLTAPVKVLTEMSIVDTPGTNAIIREHEVITARFLPRADLVLFITSVDRPFTESERAFLEKIRDWGKKIVIVLNKIDLLSDEGDLIQIETFIADNARKLLGITPEIFPVSARLAQRAKQGEPQVWETSRFEALEEFIRISLDEQGRLKLKFGSPMGVGLHLIERYDDITDTRLQLLSEDLEMLDDVERQLAIYKEDMQRDFEYRMSDIENVLFEMEQRGGVYFDEIFRLARVFDLVNKERIQNGFEKQVVGDAPQEIERKTGELVDWLVEADLRQWQAVNEHLADRRRQHKERILGDAGVGSFHYDRERLIEGISRDTQRVVETFNREEEARQLAEGAQTAVAAAAAIEVGAIGLGAIVAAAASTVAADITGVLLASFIAALGLFVIPARRRKAKHEMHSKVSVLREDLIRALRAQFEREIHRSLQKIQEAIAPYTRFVRAEQQHLQKSARELERLKNGLMQIKARVDDL